MSNFPLPPARARALNQPDKATSSGWLILKVRYTRGELETRLW